MLLTESLQCALYRDSMSGVCTINPPGCGRHGQQCCMTFELQLPTLYTCTCEEDFFCRHRAQLVHRLYTLRRQGRPAPLRFPKAILQRAGYDTRHICHAWAIRTSYV